MSTLDAPRAPVADPAAREFLRNADPVLAPLIDARPDFRPRAWMDELPPLDAFRTLVFQVAGQQLSVASTSSSVMRESDSSLRRPSANRSASARNVAPFRVEKPLSRSTWGSAASSSSGEGRCPPNRSCRWEMIARVELTDSC